MPMPDNRLGRFK